MTQWDIFDAYMLDHKKQMSDDEANKNAEKRKLAGQPVGPTEEKGRSSKEDDMVHSLKMNKALSIVERMVNQNAEDEIFQDFKFWEDVSASLFCFLVCVQLSSSLLSIVCQTFIFLFSFSSFVFIVKVYVLRQCQFQLPGFRSV